jgi:hypothetical protein
MRERWAKATVPVSELPMVNRDNFFRGLVYWSTSWLPNIRASPSHGK